MNKDLTNEQLIEDLKKFKDERLAAIGQLQGKSLFDLNISMSILNAMLNDVSSVVETVLELAERTLIVTEEVKPKATRKTKKATI